LLVAGLFWEKSTAGWWLISRANSLIISTFTTNFQHVRRHQSSNIMCRVNVWSTHHNMHVTAAARVGILISQPSARHGRSFWRRKIKHITSPHSIIVLYSFRLKIFVVLTFLNISFHYVLTRHKCRSMRIIKKYMKSRQLI
jgi:hypothetical protein